MPELQVKYLLEGTASLLWPLIVIALVLILRPAIVAIMESARSRKFSLKLGGQELTMEQAIGQVDERQKILESEIRALQIIIKGIITDFEYDKLKGLAAPGPFWVRYHLDMYKELKRLDAIRYIEPMPGQGIYSINAHDGTANEFDLKAYVRITKEGLEYLKLREELFAS